MRAKEKPYCPNCHTEDESLFYKRKSGRYYSWCKNCIKTVPSTTKEYQQEWRDNNREYHRELQRNKRKRNFITTILREIRNGYRIKTNKIEFGLVKEDLVMLDFCPILNIKLEVDAEDKDNSPSLDRIDSLQGYIKNNVVIVSNRVNRIKNDATLEELRLLSENYGRIMQEHGVIEE